MKCVLLFFLNQYDAQISSYLNVWIFFYFILKNFTIGVNSLTLVNALGIMNKQYNIYSLQEPLLQSSYDTEDWSNRCWKCSFAMTEIN